MKRRDFLQKSALTMAGIAVSGIGSFNPRKLLAADAATEDISLDILTADPDAAIREIEQLIKSAAAAGGQISGMPPFRGAYR